MKRVFIFSISCISGVIGMECRRPYKIMLENIAHIATLSDVSARDKAERIYEVMHRERVTTDCFDIADHILQDVPDEVLQAMVRFVVPRTDFLSGSRKLLDIPDDAVVRFSNGLTVDLPMSQGLKSVCVTSDDRYLVAGFNDGRILVAKPKLTVEKDKGWVTMLSAKIVDERYESCSVSRVACTDNVQKVAYVRDDHKAFVWDRVHECLYQLKDYGPYLFLDPNRERKMMAGVSAFSSCSYVLTSGYPFRVSALFGLLMLSNDIYGAWRKNDTRLPQLVFENDTTVAASGNCTTKRWKICSSHHELSREELQKIIRNRFPLFRWY